MKVFVLTIIGASKYNVSVYRNKEEVFNRIKNTIADYYDWPVNKKEAEIVKQEYDREVNKMINNISNNNEYEDEIGFQYMINECEVK